jgi:glyoxylase-like metal-dependent hydrolase (beta-lactamase superfamily II)
MALWMKTLVTGELQVNCYLLGCPSSGEAMVIDPGGKAQRILEILAENNLTLKQVVNTHGHFDHTGGNRALVEATQAELLIHPADLAILRGGAAHAMSFGCQPIEPSPGYCRMVTLSSSVSFGFR